MLNMRFNYIFQIIGVSLFGIGVWLGTVKADYDSINDALTAPVILAVVLGVCMIIFAFLGLIGAAQEKILLLKIVSTLCVLHKIVRKILNINIVSMLFMFETVSTP